MFTQVKHVIYLLYMSNVKRPMWIKQMTGAHMILFSLIWDYSPLTKTRINQYLFMNIKWMNETRAKIYETIPISSWKSPLRVLIMYLNIFIVNFGTVDSISIKADESHFDLISRRLGAKLSHKCSPECLKYIQFSICCRNGGKISNILGKIIFAKLFMPALVPKFKPFIPHVQQLWWGLLILRRLPKTTRCQTFYGIFHSSPRPLP